MQRENRSIGQYQRLYQTLCSISVCFFKFLQALTTITLASTIRKQPILATLPFYPTRYDLLSPIWLHHSINSLSLFAFHRRCNIYCRSTLNNISSIQWRYPHLLWLKTGNHLPDRPFSSLFFLESYTLKTSSYPSSLIGSSIS